MAEVAIGIMATRPLSGSSPDSLGHREAREVDGGGLRCACDAARVAFEGRERQCDFGPGLPRRLKIGAVECAMHGARCAMCDVRCVMLAVDALCRDCRDLGISATMEQPSAMVRGVCAASDWTARKQLALT